MRPIYSFAMVLLGFVAISNVYASPESLVGIYSLDNAGKIETIFRVEKQGQKFIVLNKLRDGWTPDDELFPLGKTELEKMRKKYGVFDFEGLTSKAIIFTILKVPIGWRSKSFESKTGYVFITVLGPVDVHKQ